MNLHIRQPFHTSGPPFKEMARATILIHGRSQSPADMFDIANRIDLSSMPYLALQANENSWYPAKFMEARELNQPYLDYALEAVDLAVQKLMAEGLRAENIILLGFSQGACLACEYLYRSPRRMGGLVAFTGGLIGPEGMSWPVSRNLEGTPVLLANSDEDEWVPLSRTKKTAEVFKALGCEVVLRIYPGLDHSVNDNEIELARSLLGRNLPV